MLTFNARELLPPASHTDYSTTIRRLAGLAIDADCGVLRFNSPESLAEEIMRLMVKWLPRARALKIMSRVDSSAPVGAGTPAAFARGVRNRVEDTIIHYHRGGDVWEVDEDVRKTLALIILYLAVRADGECGLALDTTRR